MSALHEVTEEGPFAESILRLTRRRIELFRDAGDDWRFAESLRAVSEDTAQEYDGRAVFELLQNAHDAIGQGQRGRVRFLLDATSGDHGTLYVANEGQPFQERNFRAITEFGLSDKGAGEGIGNKGLGFRSVLQLADWPEIFSKREPGEPAFGGYCFRFATPADVRAIVSERGLADDVIAKVSPLALPIPAEVHDERVQELADQGFVTVVRLPLRNAQAAQAACDQLSSLAEHDVPPLLFVDRLIEVDIGCVTADPWSTRLTRDEGRFELLSDLPWITTVNLGTHGRFLRATRTVAPDAMRRAVAVSIEAREIDEKWRAWDGEATVSIALALDSPPELGRLYTFLPMTERAPSPCAAHAHAPFFTTLARLDISETVALNAFLLDEIAALARDLLLELVRLDPADLPPGVTVDLAAWRPPDRMRTAFAAIGRDLCKESLVPVLGKQGWASLEDAHRWPYSSTSIVHPNALTRLGVRIVDDQLDVGQQERLERLHVDLVGESMSPSPSQAADWVERLAARLVREKATFARWADFYDDLAAIFTKSPDALAGRSIILDQDRQLSRALGGDGSKQTVFFAPEDGGTDSPSRLPGDLRALRRRINFTHPEIPWNYGGTPPRRRPGRAFLEADLVREYRTDRVFDALEELLQRSQTEAFRRDALLFAFRQYPSLNDSQRAQLRGRHFFVPSASGSWQTATVALFHPQWGTDGARRLERFLSAGGDSIAEFTRLRDRWIAPPSEWPEAVDDAAGWESFLRSLGVRDGLPLYYLGARLAERDGNALRPETLAVQFKLDEDLSRAWPALVRRTWSEFRHPWTKYAFDRVLAYIPGAQKVEELSTRARLEFGELVMLGLRNWDDSSYSVRIRRPTRPLAQQDPHQWPTPLAAQLAGMSWIPLADDSAPGGMRFVPPNHVWHATEGDLPAFIASLPVSTRRLITEDTTLRRLRDAGLRIWEDEGRGAELVHDLGALLEAGAVPAHLTVHFKKHYQRGWAAAARCGRWPWNDDDVPVLAVVESSMLAAVRADAGGLVFVADEDNHFKESLLDLAGYPVLVADTADGAALRTFLASHDLAVKGFSETDVLVEADNKIVTPAANSPLLVDHAPWLPTVFGLVLELRSGEFRRRSERAIREAIELVRMVRILHADDVRVLIENAAAETPPSTQSLPVDDDRFPTIVVWGVDRGGWDVWRSVSPALCQLLNQPGLQAALELTIVKLQALHAGEVPRHLSDEDLASALNVQPHRVAELRRGLMGEFVELVYRLRPAVMALLGVHRLGEICQELDRVADEDELELVLESWRHDLPTGVEPLMAAVHGFSTLGELRDALGIEFRLFNDVLGQLGPPYRPITHPEAHAHAFAELVGQWEGRLLERIRERYAALAIGAGDISRYVEARRLEGLEPDPAWLLDYEIPPESLVRRAVGRWLEGHGTSVDLDAPPELTDLATLREHNFALVTEVAEEVAVRVAAWCRLNERAIPSPWSAVPGMSVRSAIEADGVADLVALSREFVLERAAKVLGWPTNMPVTLSLDELGLTESDLAHPSTSVPGSTPPPRPAPTIAVGDRRLPVGVEHFAEIASAAFASVDESFLAQKGSAELGEAPGPATRRKGGIGRPIVVARTPGMTEEQRGAVGLVGEVAARAWLERRYEVVRWRSGYAAVVTGDPEASDSWGYDFEVPHGKTSRFYEVKSTVDQPRDLTEFEMGESEVLAAQECAGGNRYNILLVTSVLEPAERRIFLLPSPFSKRGAGRFRVVGRGLRYRCELKA